MIAARHLRLAKATHGPLAALLVLIVGLAPVPASATERLVSVSNASLLRMALDAPLDGDIIELANGTYDPAGVPFAVPPTSSARFTIRAANPGGAVIDGGNGAGACGTRSRLFDHQAGNAWVIFDGLVFRDACTEQTGTSGGIDIRNGAHATFVDCRFVNNSAVIGPPPGASSGAVLVTGSSHAQFVGCAFIGNTSDNHGGAMLVGQGSIVFIHDSTFTGNRNNINGHRDNGLGGAIHVFNGLGGTTARLYVGNSRFEGNEAAFVGGAIMAKGSFDAPVAPVEVMIANSTFVDNVTNPMVVPASPLEGGAISIENNVSLEVYFSRFSGNSSDLGGAIASYRGEVFVRSSEFRGNNAADGQGGAIKAHSNDICSNAVNFPSASVDVADSFFESNTAQFGGAIFVAGDTVRMGYVPAQPCPLESLAENRSPVTISRSAFFNNSVDNTSPTNNNALGGSLYGNLVDATITDSLFLDSSANATDSPVTIAGGAAAFLLNSKIRFTGSTFGGNSALGEGGAIYLWGGEIASFTSNVFFENTVVNGNSAATSRGAALLTRPDEGLGIDVIGAVTDSVFTDNDGTPIYELDTSPERNRVTYSGNTFHNTRFGSDVFVNVLEFEGRTAAELNTLVVNGIDKGSGNGDNGSTVTTAALLATPPQTLPAGAANDPPGSTDAFLAWAWSGGCAELQGSPLNTQVTGFSTPGIGSRNLEVWDGACSAGAADASDTAAVTNAGGPSATLVANPIAINIGQSSALSWSLIGAPFLAGRVSHGVSDFLPSGSGNQTVSPPATTRYRFLLLTTEGSATQVQGVFVDQPPDATIFTDGFESGDISAWN